MGLFVITCFVGKSFAQIPIVPLIPNQDAPKLNEYIRYSTDYTGELKYADLLSVEDDFEKLTGPSIEFGMTDKPVLLLIKMKNSSSLPGEWIFSMGRKTFHDFKLWEFNEVDEVLKLDNQNLELVKQNTWRYMTLAVPIKLEPDEIKLFGIMFEPKNTFHLPLSIRTAENYYHSRRISDAITFGSIAGILILVVVNASFYIVTRLKGFIWLALAEAFYTLQILSSAGYTSYFSGYSDPAQGDLVAAVGKCLYCIFIAKFAQDFVSTQRNFPKVNILLKALILMSGLTLIQILFHHFIIGGPNMLSLTASWVLVLLITMILPYIAFKATFSCLLYTSPSPRDATLSRMPSSA